VSGSCGDKVSVTTNGGVSTAAYAYCSPNSNKTQVASIANAVQVSLFHLIGPIRNSPPKVDLIVAIETDENVRTTPRQMLYTDDELDKVTFSLDSTIVEGGVANMTEDGLFTFEPAFAFNGKVSVTYTVTEYFDEDLDIVPLTATGIIEITVAPVPSNPTLSRVYLETNEVESDTRAYVIGFANDMKEFNLLLLDFDGDDVTLLHKNLPSGSDYDQTPTDVTVARTFAESYMLAHCMTGNASCGYPLSHMQADSLNVAAHVVTINAPLQEAYSVTTVKMIAKDSTGLFSATTFELDLIACPRGEYFVPAATPICQPVSECGPGTHAQTPPNPAHDTICLDDTTTTVTTTTTFDPAGKRLNADAVDGDSDDSSDNLGLIIGLCLFFLLLVCAIGACIALTKKRQDQEKFRAGADGINLVMSDMSTNKITPAQDNPMYFANSANAAIVSNQDNYQTGGATNYSVPFGNDGQVDYSVPFEEDGADYDNNDSFVVKGSGDKTYAIPVDPVSNPLYFAGGAGGAQYAVPIEGDEDYQLPAAANEPVAYHVPMEAPRLLISMAQAQAIYGRPGQDISGVTDNNVDDIYGALDDSDMHSRPAWLFTNKLDRAAAEDLIKTHGNRKGMFLVRVKSDNTFVVTMKASGGKYEHHVVEKDAAGGMQLNKKSLDGVGSLEGVVYTMSKDNEHVPTKLTEAICIPEIASDVGTVPWVHGSMHASNAEAILGGENGSRPGLFLVYQNAANGCQTLCVVDESSAFTHHVITKDGCDCFCLNGTRLSDPIDGDVYDWVGFRGCLAKEGQPYCHRCTKAICRERCPVGRLCSSNARPAWLYDPISRKSAGHLLAGCPDGTYLVRESIDSPFEFKVDHVQARKIHHNKAKYTDGEWNVDGRVVPGCDTLEDLLAVMKDRSKSGLPFNLVKAIENEDAYMIVPATEVLSDANIVAADYLPSDQAIYSKARAANEAVYMDDLLLAGANEVPMYSTAGESSEHVVVDPTTGSVYQASTFADSMGEYMNPDESGGTQAQDYMDVGNGDGTYQVLMDDSAEDGVYAPVESTVDGLALGGMDLDQDSTVDAPLGTRHVTRRHGSLAH